MMRSAPDASPGAIQYGYVGTSIAALSKVLAPSLSFIAKCHLRRSR